MGVVYEARDRARGNLVALKTLSSFDPDSLLRFKTEFRSLQDVHHPNLVRLYELVEEAGQWYFTMELVRGISFADWVRPDDARLKADVTREASAEEATADLTSGSPRADAGAARAAAPLGRYDEARLRATLLQVADALSTLHAARKVHCDIKPANVLVSDDGRAVVLDFGIILDMASRRSAPSKIIGTAAFMAPEQAALRPLSGAADWYGVGAMLYLALTGRPPFVGPSDTILELKQRCEPVPPDYVVPDLPRDLTQLCVDLLRHDPALRPDGREVRRRLSRGAAVEVATAPLGHDHFIGRQPELRQLQAALAGAAAGGATVLLRGESGLGKSALTSHFAAACEADGAMVLAGRCYERETVPFKAVDEVMDAISRELAGLDGERVTSLLPVGAGLLAQAFPTLRRVAVWGALEPEIAPIEPRHARALVFAALRELLARLAATRPVVMAIDDLQWADADSVLLLTELMRAPAPPGLLLLLVMRDGPDADAQVQRLEAALPALSATVTVRPLSRAESQQLAALLLPAGGEGVQRIADDAAGHPMFIDALARRRAVPSAGDGGGTLDEALWARAATASSVGQRVLELLSIAHMPLPSDVIERAAAVDVAALSHALAELRALKLVRVGGTPERVEPYHDRIRSAVRAHVGERQPLHARLARALEAHADTQPEALAVHWSAAGEPQRALGHATAAARQAADALSFERAARLYQMALDLLSHGDPRRPTLLAQRAEALANAGRGGEAADAFVAAATVETDDARALELRRRAAEQYLGSGRIDDGLRTLHEVLGAVGLALPETPTRALVSLLVNRALVRLRGIGFRPRDPGAVSPSELARIDVCWAGAVGLGLVDTIRGAHFQARHMLLALRAGDRYRVARALSAEACYSSTGGVPAHARTQRLLETARRLSEEIGDPRAIGFARGAAGLTSVQEGRWRDGRSHCDAAEAQLRERCQGVAWEVFTAQYFSLASLSYLGEIAEMQRRLPLVLRQAEERGDLNGVTTLKTSLTNIVWLAADAPDEARQQIDEAMRAWSRQGYQMQHYYTWYAAAQVALYLGQAAAAHAHVESGLRALERSLLTRVQLIRVMVRDLRGRSAVAAAAQARGSERKRLLLQGWRAARQLLGEDAAWAHAYGQVLRAQLFWLEGDHDGAAAGLADAATRLEATELGLSAAVVRQLRGRILGGDAGAQLRGDATQWMRTQQIRNVARMCALVAPGFADAG